MSFQPPQPKKPKKPKKKDKKGRETEREFNIHDKWCVFTETERAERDCSLGLFSHGDSETKSCFLLIIETIAV